MTTTSTADSPSVPAATIADSPSTVVDSPSTIVDIPSAIVDGPSDTAGQYHQFFLK